MSLLVRIYGIFSIKTNYFDPIDIIVMQNTSILQNKMNPRVTFDLKGSFIGRKTRFAPKEEKFWLQSLNHGRVLKDMNFLEINQDLDNCLMYLSKPQF
jgi:hypothetical protein